MTKPQFTKNGEGSDKSGTKKKQCQRLRPVFSAGFS
jgi:hypothetical protein